MTNPSRRKGDRAEREVERLLQDELGVPARRALGAGRKDDIGDITGVPNTVIQVADWADLDRCVREKLPELERQRRRAWHMTADGNGLDDVYSALWCRRRGGRYVVVLEPEMWCAMRREIGW